MIEHGTTAILGAREVSCGAPDCPVRAAVASPVVDGDAVVGAFVAYGRDTSAMLVRAVEEVARWVSGQVEFAALDAERTQAIGRQNQSAGAQISARTSSTTRSTAWRPSSAPTGTGA